MWKILKGMVLLFLGWWTKVWELEFFYLLDEEEKVIVCKDGGVDSIVNRYRLMECRRINIRRGRERRYRWNFERLEGEFYMYIFLF